MTGVEDDGLQDSRPNAGRGALVWMLLIVGICVDLVTSSYFELGRRGDGGRWGE